MSVPAYTLGWLRCFELTSQNLQLGFTLEEKKGHQQTHHGLVGGEEFLAGTGDEELIVLYRQMKALQLLRIGNDQIILVEGRNGPTIVQPLHVAHSKFIFLKYHDPEIASNFRFQF